MEKQHHLVPVGEADAAACDLNMASRRRPEGKARHDVHWSSGVRTFPTRATVSFWVGAHVCTLSPAVELRWLSHSRLWFRPKGICLSSHPSVCLLFFSAILFTFNVSKSLLFSESVLLSSTASEV